MIPPMVMGTLSASLTVEKRIIVGTDGRLKEEDLGSDTYQQPGRSLRCL